MCTIGYNKKLNVIFKNRDKTSPTSEKIIADDKLIACRTRGANYYSWGINKYGCTFVSAAINTPQWTKLVYDGKLKEAQEQYEDENKDLQNPMVCVSEMLPDVRLVDNWLEALESSNTLWMGYNLLIADRQKVYLVEFYKDQSHIRELTDSEVITNHFQTINHGPMQETDYPSSFGRYKYGNSKITSAETFDDIYHLLMHDNREDNSTTWRKGNFFTISSSVIDFQNCSIDYTKTVNEKYTHFSFNGRPKINNSLFEDIGKFEMSRYIDLDLYHEVERSHPFYEEMIEEICKTIKNYCDPEKNYRILEIGSGTGLCTEDLLKIPFVEVSALEIDSECCQILGRHIGHSKCEVINGDAVTFCREGYYDIVVSTFAHDHIHYDRALEFVQNIKKNLRKGGIYIMGAEFLPYYRNKEERENALLTYHGYIVNKALWERHYRLAQIEINALESGIDMIGDFKRHELMFEEEMTAGGMTLISKEKMGPKDPDNVGGIFVYVYEA